MAKVRLEANTQAWCVVEQSIRAGDGGRRSDRDEVECVGRWAGGWRGRTGSRQKAATWGCGRAGGSVCQVPACGRVAGQRVALVPAGGRVAGQRVALVRSRWPTEWNLQPARWKYAL